MLFFHALPVLPLHGCFFRALLDLVAQDPCFVLSHLLVPGWSLSDPAPLQRGCDFWASRARASFQHFVVLMPAQHMDLAQPVTASIKGQCTLSHSCEFLQNVSRESHWTPHPSVREVPFGTHLIDLLHFEEHRGGQIL